MKKTMAVILLLMCGSTLAHAQWSGQEPVDTYVSPSALPPIPQGAIDVTTGQYFPPAAGGVTNPQTGTFYQSVGGGYINTQTGEFAPAQ